jgi:hypothetical protein
MICVEDAPVMPDDTALAADVLADLQQEPMGLYQVLHAANSLYPRAPMSARVAAAERVIRRLVADDRVRLWRGLWIGPEHDREPVTVDALKDILLTHATWQPEGGQDVIWMELLPDET